MTSRCPGVRVVAALNAAGERCAVRVRSHKNLTAGKMLTWLTLVDDTAKEVIEKHQRAGTVGEIERAEAVTWVGSEAGLTPSCSNRVRFAAGTS